MIAWTSRRWARSQASAATSSGAAPGTNNLGRDWDLLHVRVDNASRRAYTEILPSERKDTIAFLERALVGHARQGVTVERVMTDNGSPYRSKLFATALQQAGAPRPNPALSGLRSPHRRPAQLALSPQLARPHGAITSQTPISRLAPDRDNLLRLHT